MKRSPRYRLLGIFAALLTALASLVAVSATPAFACPPGAPSCVYDEHRDAWFGGYVVDHFAQIPAPMGSGPSGPEPERPDQTIYLVGNVTATPFAPGLPIPGVGYMPDHDHVWSTWPTGIVDGYGQMVIPGPNATAANVKTRPMPEGSLAGAPLAYSIKLGFTWFDLTSSQVIELGLAGGQLATFDIGWGGVGWIEHKHH
ncbi:hypothetical protein [Actinocorallia sp. A-T 12471]|uniref:hypothetical protein n=1 Tax=Actinocorallia sp. A-T 12471 TaxID=3089813 RepID=UPI0029CD0940|nr:hypothetical protein [Actinocorallia sp. A-T 12471]MDX6742416.1 hypothetical protein [Actinocorallia sp. A-T 12471]